MNGITAEVEFTVEHPRDIEQIKKAIMADYPQFVYTTDSSEPLILTANNPPSDLIWINAGCSGEKYAKELATIASEAAGHKIDVQIDIDWHWAFDECGVETYSA